MVFLFNIKYKTINNKNFIQYNIKMDKRKEIEHILIRNKKIEK